MNCYHCGATTTNGLALCDLCQRKATAVFEVLPIYFRNLARWRPGRAGSRAVPGSRQPSSLGSATIDRVSDALDEALNALSTWARALMDARPQVLANQPVEAIFGDLSDMTEAEQVRHLCTGFERWLVSIAVLDWCGAFVAEVSEHEAALRALTEAAAPGWYAGSCKICTAPTFVVPGLTWLTCRACGSVTSARDRAEIILEEAGDWVARPKAIAEAIVALIDTEPSVPKLYTRIRQWAFVGDIKSIKRTTRDHVWSDEANDFVVGVVEVGHARYRLGEVLDRVLAKNTPAAVEHRAS